MPNISFTELIKKVDVIESACIRDEVKLRRSGELIHLVSEQILQKANTLLEKLHSSEIDETDTKVDRSFSDFLVSLTQQSISTLFLAKYLQPQQKAEYYRETTKSVKFLSATEALDKLAEDIVESEIFALAHDENIEVWIESVKQHLKLHPKINTLPDIARLNDLTLAQTFVAALFGNFQLEQTGDFYEVERLSLFL